MRPNTLANYNFVRNILKNEPFGSQKISKIKTSDAKLFLIKMQQEDGRGHSTIKTVRGVLRPAFQMAVDDDVLMKNPFQLCAQLRVCSQAGGNPVYPRFSQPDNSESWDDVGNASDKRRQQESRVE